MVMKINTNGRGASSRGDDFLVPYDHVFVFLAFITLPIAACPLTGNKSGDG
jgi:hypothetical protein